MQARPRHPSKEDIEDRIEDAIWATHKQYWVADTCNGHDEFHCDELSFEEFRDACAEIYGSR